MEGPALELFKKKVARIIVTDVKDGIMGELQKTWKWVLLYDGF